MKNILLDVLMFIIKTFSNIFVVPIIKIITLFIPEVSSYIVQTQTFFTQNVFQPMRFCIRFLLNVTGLPQTILVFAFTYLALKITLHVSMQVVKLIIRLWGIVKP